MTDGNRVCDAWNCTRRRAVDQRFCPEHVAHPTVDRRAHVIAAVSYAHGGDPELAPIDCACGWSGLSRDFQPHRVEHGARRKAYLDRLTVA